MGCQFTWAASGDSIAAESQRRFTARQQNAGWLALRHVAATSPRPVALKLTPGHVPAAGRDVRMSFRNGVKGVEGAVKGAVKRVLRPSEIREWGVKKTRLRLCGDLRAKKHTNGSRFSECSTVGFVA
jgi:hypothetical protein